MNRVRVKSPGTAKAVLDAVTLPDVLISAGALNQRSASYR